MNAKLFTVVLSLFVTVQAFSRPAFTIMSQVGVPGQDVCVNVQVTDFTDITNLNFALQLGAAQYDFLNLQQFNLPGLSEDNFIRSGANQEIFNVTWNADTSVTLPNGTSLFQICFKIANNCDRTPIRISNFFVTTAADPSTNIGATYAGGAINNPRCPVIDTRHCLTGALSSAKGMPGDTVCLDFTVEEFQQITSMGFSLGFDTTKLGFVSITKSEALTVDDPFFNIDNAQAGRIGISWNPQTSIPGDALPDGTQFFSICLKVKGAPGDTALISFTNAPFSITFLQSGSFGPVTPNLIEGKVIVETKDLILQAEPVCIENAGCINDRDGKIELAVTGGTAPYTYQWSGPNGYTSTLEDLRGLYPGDYIGTITDATGKMVTIGPLTIAPLATLVTIQNSSLTFCNTNTLPIQITADPTVNSYNWSSKSGLVSFSCTTCATPVLLLPSNFNEIGVFQDTLRLIVTSTKSCRDTIFAPVSIRFYDIFPQEELFACIGDTLVLNENNPLPASGTFSWQGPNGFSSSAPTVQIPNVTPNLSGNYTFNYIDTAGCTYEADLNIKVSDYPKIINTTLNPPICPNSFPSGSIFIELPHSEGGYTATWSGQGEPTPLISDTLIGRVSLAAGQYFVTITNAAGCAIDTSFTLIDPPAPQITINTTPSCGSTTAGSISLSIVGNNAPYKISWSTGDTTNTVQNLPPGNYAVNITDNKNCNAYRDVLVPGTAFASKTPGGVYAGFPGSVQLTANAFNATSIRWEPADQIINGDSFTAIPEPDSVITTYIATISDGQGCEAKDTVVVVSGVSTELGFPGAERDKVTKWCYEIDNPAAYRINRIVSTDALVLSNPKIVDGSLCIEYTSNISGDVIGDVDSIYLEICPIAGGSCEVIGGLIYVLQVVVYTGDTNDDGIVNHLDLLNIGIANGATGPSRFINPNFWSGTTTYLWEGQYTPGTHTNYAHIDADGNGRIEVIDTNVIRQFWGNTHEYAGLQSPITIEPRGIGAPLFIEASTLKPGEIMRLPIILGNAATPASNAYGTAFTIQYDPAIIDTASVSLEFTDSWLGIHNQDFIGLYKNFGTSGKIEAAFTRLNQQSVNGSGTIAYLNLRVREDVTGNPAVRFAIEEPVLISAQEEVLPVEPMTTEASITTSAHEAWLDSKISIFPNPAKAMLHIHATDVMVESVILYNVNGQAVLQNSTTNSFSVESLEAGLYFCKIQTDKGLIVKKISVIR